MPSQLTIMHIHWQQEAHVAHAKLVHLAHRVLLVETEGQVHREDQETLVHQEGMVRSFQDHRQSRLVKNVHLGHLVHQDHLDLRVFQAHKETQALQAMMEYQDFQDHQVHLVPRGRLASLEKKDHLESQEKLSMVHHLVLLDHRDRRDRKDHLDLLGKMGRRVDQGHLVHLETLERRVPMGCLDSMDHLALVDHQGSQAPVITARLHELVPTMEDYKIHQKCY